LDIRDLKPGMDNVSMKVKVSSISGSKQITTGVGVEHEIVELEVRDETGSITLVLWDNKIIPIEVGDTLQFKNGFVTSFKGIWRINVGKYGDVVKIESER